MKQFLRRISVNRTSLMLSLAAVLVVIGWRGVVVARKPAHMSEVADELATVCQFPFTMVPNHSGTQVVFKQLNETGTGIYLGDLASGKKKLVCHQEEKGWSWQAFVMLGWSPEDRLFACAFPPHDPQQPREEILICDGKSGEIVVKLAADWKFAELAWLTPKSFAYSWADTDKFDIAVIEQKSETEWAQIHTFKKLADKTMSGLVATSENSVAWKQGNSVWSLDVTTGTSGKIWESTTNLLGSFTFSDTDKEFLLNCSDETGQFLIRYYPPTKWTAVAERISQQTNTVPCAIWFNKGTRYAYLNRDNGSNTFCIKANNNPELARLPWPGEILNYTIDGNHLYVSGYLANATPGIWRYDFDSADVRRVVPSSETGLRYSHIVPPTGEVVTNISGRQKVCYLWPPAKMSPGRKYPVILSQGVFRGGVYPQAAANAGFYYALAARPSWFEGVDDWKRDVLEAYRVLIQNPNIDSKRIFLSATSFETATLCEFIDENPELWKGVVLLSPSMLPDLSKTKLESIFIVSGTDDGDAPKRLSDYQNRAAELGIYVKLFFVEGAGHNTIRSIGSARGQLRQYAEFLSEN